LCTPGADRLDANVAFPRYTAKMKCGPAGSAVVENCAIPPESGAVPRSVPPSRNATVPVGVTVPPSGITAAASVARWPSAVGLLADTTKVNVDCARGRTVIVVGDDVLAAKFGVPSYLAVMAWAPGAVPFTVSAAVPDDSGAVPIGVAPSKKVTVPVGTPAPGASTPTDAVSRYGCRAATAAADADTVVVVDAGPIVSRPDWKSIRKARRYSRSARARQGVFPTRGPRSGMRGAQISRY
jgi:hypothetical protein